MAAEQAGPRWGGQPVRGGTPTPPDLASLICSFCGKSREQVPKLFAGRGVSDPSTGAVIAPVYICNECVVLCADTLAEEV
jgi:hypothetical protein